MKKILKQKIPTIYSIVVIGLILIILVGYTSFKAGEIYGRNKMTNEFKSTESFVKRKISKIMNDRAIRDEAKRVFNEIEDQYKRTDVRSLISTWTPEEMHQKRKQLIYFLWGSSELPKTKMPSKINRTFYDRRYKDLYKRSLEKINYVLIDMDFGLQSNIYHFIPKKKNGRLVIFHEGHDGDFINNIDLIDNLLASGFSVAAFCMPLLGINNTPAIQDPRLGFLKLTTHDHFKFLIPEKGHPIKYFVEPVVVFLNHESSKYKDISMIGISGGGWTTTLVSAFDCRITNNFTIAGSYPIYLRSDSESDWGDYEQTAPELYRTCNYLELYILGSFGQGRRQLQVINKYDYCCFAGVKWKTYYSVLRKLSKNRDDIEWDLYMDDSHTKHMISKRTQLLILTELNTK